MSYIIHLADRNNQCRKASEHKVDSLEDCKDRYGERFAFNKNIPNSIGIKVSLLTAKQFNDLITITDDGNMTPHNSELEVKQKDFDSSSTNLSNCVYELEKAADSFRGFTEMIPKMMVALKQSGSDSALNGLVELLGNTNGSLQDELGEMRKYLGQVLEQNHQDTLKLLTVLKDVLGRAGADQLIVQGQQNFLDELKKLFQGKLKDWTDSVEAQQSKWQEAQVQLTAKATDYEQKLEHKIQTLKNLESDIEESTDDLVKTVKKYRPGEVELLKQQLETLNKTLREKDEELTTLRTELFIQKDNSGKFDRKLWEDVLERNQKLQGEVDKLQHLNGENLALQQDRLTLQRYKEQEIRSFDQQEELSRLQRFESQHKDEFMSLKEKVNNLEERNKDLRREKREIQLQRQEYEELDSTRTELNALKQNKKVLDKDHEVIKAQLREKDNKCLELQQKLDQGERFFRASMEQEFYARLREEMDAQYCKRLDFLTHHLKNSDEDKQRFRKLCEEAKQDFENEQQRHETTRQRLEELEKAGALDYKNKYEVLLSQHSKLLDDLPTKEKQQKNLEIYIKDLDLRREDLLTSVAKLQGQIEQEQEKQDHLNQRQATRVQQAKQPWSTKSFEKLLVSSEADWLRGIEEGIQSQGFDFSPRLLRAFHTSLKTQMISPLTMLMGISGTGKSELPKLYSDYGGIHFLNIAVQPNWDSPSDMFGYFNYAKSCFDSTDLTRALRQFSSLNERLEHRRRDQVMLVLLDEMNLARIEYYFSELLSKLETRRSEMLRHNTLDWGIPGLNLPRFSIKLDMGDEEEYLCLSPNVLFTGSLNQDESTVDVSDKVLDRANVITFPRPANFKTLNETRIETQSNSTETFRYLPLEKWQAWCTGHKKHDEEFAKNMNEEFQKLNRALGKVNRGVGQRVYQAVLEYIKMYPCSHPDDLEALKRSKIDAKNDQYAMKILPKLKGIETDSREGKACLEDVRALIHESLHETFDDSCKGDFFEWRGSSTMFKM